MRSPKLPVALAFLGLPLFMPGAECGQIRTDEAVAFHGPYLHWNADDQLVVVLRGRVYEKVQSTVRRKAIEQGILKYIGKRAGDFEAGSLELLSDRVLRFLEDGESGKSVRVRVRGQAGEETIELPKTDASGYFAATITAGKRPLTELLGTGAKLDVEAVLSAQDTRQFKVSLPVPPRPLPLLVISDVDDTVRIAEVTVRPRMIERTFLRPYEAVPGMAQVYSELAARGAWFHYVSGSPRQLGTVIERFLCDAQFPTGVLHCRRVSWNFWENDPLDTRSYKVAEIRALLDRFGGCKVLLVGDSAEHDPEVYTDICREFSDRVAGVWIRRVNDAWDPDRLADARELIGSQRVATFGDAEELEPAAQRLHAK